MGRGVVGGKGLGRKKEMNKEKRKVKREQRKEDRIWQRGEGCLYSIIGMIAY